MATYRLLGIDFGFRPGFCLCALFCLTADSMLQQDTVDTGKYGRRGSPWEFNLRDVFRWCELMITEQSCSDGHRGGDMDVDPDSCEARWEPWLVVDTLYVQRMRTEGDRQALLARFKEAFPEAFPQQICTQGSFKERSSDMCLTGSLASNVPDRFLSAGGLVVAGIGTHPVLRVTPEWIQVGHTVLPRGCWSDTCGTGGAGVGDELKSGMPMAFAFRRPLQALARSVVVFFSCQVVFLFLRCAAPLTQAEMEL